ncbi:MAG: (Fe-S)-binding protein [bacterium]
MPELLGVIKKNNVFYCLECGKCTASCPVAQVNDSYSPRSIVAHTMQHSEDDVLSDPMLWACLTCKSCEPVCPAEVDYTNLTLELRAQARENGQQGRCTHGGALQSLMRIMTTPDLKQNRLDWLNSDLKTAETGEVLYFVGCAPYFDVFFSDLGVKTLDAARSVIKLLNAIGIDPVLMPNERCCGHDLLWSGDRENFVKLAEHNLEAIQKTGAKKVVFSCPECYRTLKEDYAAHFGSLGFDTLHITEVMADKLQSEKNLFPSNNREQKVTFQDPCRLGRHLGVYEAPREVLTAVPGVQLNDMPKSGKKAVCCGVSNWMNCTTYSKQIQVERLRQAKATGANTLMTACPKCEVHLRCAMKDVNLGKEINMEIKDVATLATEALADS